MKINPLRIEDQPAFAGNSVFPDRNYIVINLDKISSSYRSPNTNHNEISVELVVVHYTGTTFDRTRELFLDPTSKVSAHLVIDRDGSVFEFVQCLSGPAHDAWHAGRSRCEHGGVVFEELNRCAVGIELVNLNGNVFEYTDAQYSALNTCINALVAQYPLLVDRTRIVGHEHVAGWRGKCDPGRAFDWSRIGVVGGRSLEPRCAEPIACQFREVFFAMAPDLFSRGPGEFLRYATLPPTVPVEVYEALSTLCERICDA